MMKEKLFSLIVLGISALALDTAIPDFNNWFAVGANAVELTELVYEMTDSDVFVHSIIEFIF